MSGIPARDSSGSRDELADDPSQAVAAGAEPSSSSATHGTTPTQSSRFPSSLSHTAQRLPIHRSLSQSSHHHWSPNETPTHHHQGTSYFNLSSTRPTSPRRTNFSHSTRTMSAASVKRRGARSTSVASSHATNRGYRDDGELVSEEEHSAIRNTQKDEMAKVIVETIAVTGIAMRVAKGMNTMRASRKEKKTPSRFETDSL